MREREREGGGGGGGRGGIEEGKEGEYGGDITRWKYGSDESASHVPAGAVTLNQVPAGNWVNLLPTP